jgi:hypothetical protein
MKGAEPTRLGLHIAYSCARSDIECFARAAAMDTCAAPLEQFRQRFHDLSAPIADTFERESVAMAAQWLEAMNLLRRHPSYPHLVQVADEPLEWSAQGELAAAQPLQAEPA